MSTPSDLSARLPELPFPDHVDAFGDNSYNADQMRDYAIAALSALPAAGGEPVAVVIPNVVGVEIAWIDPPSAGRPPVGTKLYTTTQPSAAEPNKTCGVCGSHRIRKHPKGTECMDCRTIHHHHAAVGTQGEVEDLLLCLQRTTEVLEADERSVSAEFVKRAITLIRRLTAPAAGKGVDFDAWHDAKWPEPEQYGHKIVWRQRKADRRAAWQAALTRQSAAVSVEALEGLVAKLLNESESNFRRQFGDSNSAGWVYTDLRELFADELTQLIKERSNG